MLNKWYNDSKGTNFLKFKKIKDKSVTSRKKGTQKNIQFNMINWTKKKCKNKPGKFSKVSFFFHLLDSCKILKWNIRFM